MTPEAYGFVVVELFKHKERIAAATDLHEDDLLECLKALLARVTFDPFTFKERVR